MGLAKVVKVMTDHPGAFSTDTNTYLRRHPSKPYLIQTYTDGTKTCLKLYIKGSRDHDNLGFEVFTAV